jgi:hypothetical protein
MADVQQVKNEIDAGISARVTLSSAHPYLDFRALLDIVVGVLADGKLTQEDFEPVADYVEELFDKHVRPYDIPGIGPVAEAFVDDTARRLIRPALAMLFAKFAASDAGGSEQQDGDDEPIVTL